MGDFITYQEKEEEINKLSHIPNGFYEINGGGYLDLPEFLKESRNVFKKNNAFKNDWINERDVIYSHDGVKIKDLSSKNIIWCTGNYAMQNSTFNYLPFKLTRGEMMKFVSGKLSQEFIFNKNFFVIPRGDHFVSGATYSRDISKTVTEDGLKDMQEKLAGIVKPITNFKEHYFGIRPTVADRKPYIGRHPERPHCYILNGLGSKGVTQGPYFAKELLNFIFNDGELTPEANILRHEKKFFKSKN